MAIEIEKKFLVTGDFTKFVISKRKIKQGYLSTHHKRTVRVRIDDMSSTITIKGKSSQSGASRYEWEKEISKVEAEELLLLCDNLIVTKTRHIIPEDSGLKFEVDVFHGNNHGLVVAEIELPRESYDFALPNWLGKEITGETKYYNSNLAINPFKNW